MKTFLLLFSAALVCLQAADETGAEMLKKAALVGDLNTIETLLTSGLDPNMPVDRLGETALSFALANGKPQAVRLLLSLHADPNIPMNGRRDGGSFTPLQYAAQSGDTRMASALIANGAGVRTKGSAGTSPLQLAVSADHLDMMRLLIENGAEVNDRDSEGASPLDDAVWRGYLDGAAILLAHGARLNQPDTQTGATPANEAAFRGHAKVLQYLLQFHPDLAAGDKRGYTPLDNAIRQGKQDSALLILDAEPEEQLTPQFLAKTMDAAIRRDQGSLVDVLLRQGAGANTILPSGYTPLDAAAFAGSTKTALLLLDRGADPNLIGKDGTTPLEDASLRGLETLVTSLLDHGAQVNHLNPSSGATALYSAAAAGKTGVVKSLLNRGADPRLCGTNHKSPYQAAAESGDSETAAEIKAIAGEIRCR